MSDSLSLRVAFSCERSQPQWLTHMETKIPHLPSGPSLELLCQVPESLGLPLASTASTPVVVNMATLTPTRQRQVQTALYTLSKKPHPAAVCLRLIGQTRSGGYSLVQSISGVRFYPDSVAALKKIKILLVGGRRGGQRVEGIKEQITVLTTPHVESSFPSCRPEC